MRAFDNLAFDDLFGQQADRPTSAPGRRLRAGQRDELCLTLTIEDGLNRRRLALFAGEHRVEPLGYQLLTHPGHHGNVGVQRAADFFVGPALTPFALIGLEQNACLENGLCLGFALRDQLAQSLALLAAEFDYEFFVGHVAPPCLDIRDRSRISVRGAMQQLFLSGTSH